jgi:hypothetical protein
MGADFVAKLMIGIVAKFMTDVFLSKILIYAHNAWAQDTENKLDDKVVKAMADALGVSVEEMPTSAAGK